MERLKDILALSPFVALAIAVSFLEGYWGAFDVLAFPYLGFQELLAYSAAPLFGFIIFALSGVLFSVIPLLANRSIRIKNYWFWLWDTGFGVFCALLIYFDIPEKWLFTPFVIYGVTLTFLFKSEVIQSVSKENPQTLLFVLLMIFMMLGSFGYGRSKAVELIQRAEPNVRLLVDGQEESGKFIGKLGAHYFFINSSKQVTVLPERAVNRIEYR